MLPLTFLETCCTCSATHRSQCVVHRVVVNVRVWGTPGQGIKRSQPAGRSAVPPSSRCAGDSHLVAFYCSRAADLFLSLACDGPTATVLLVSLLSP